MTGEPRIVERDGERCLVDDAGEEQVLRPKNNSQNRIYHAADLDAFEAGEIRPACRVSAHKPDGAWRLCRQAALDGIWRPCTFHPCWGGAESNAPRGGEDAPPAQESTLAAKLRSMSAEEYDREGIDVSQYTGGRDE